MMCEISGSSWRNWLPSVNRICNTQRFFQFQGDADDLKAWLVDAMRQMSSDDVGHDEYTTQRLLKKHRDLRDEAAKNGATIDALSKQANALPEELRNTPDIQGSERYPGYVY